MQTLRWKALIVFVVAFSVSVSFAQQTQVVAKRAVTLEWESFEDVTGYEVEVTRIMKDGERRKPLYFKTKNSVWSAKIFPGKYEMRLRSRDDRGVYGDWSEASLFWVKLPPPNLLSPKSEALVSTNETEKYIQEFKWANVPGAGSYRLEILNDQGQVIQTHDVTETTFKTELEVAKKYSWKVTTLMPEGAEPGEVPEKSNLFSLMGKKLTPPKVTKPDTKFVTEVSWEKPEFSEEFAYAVMRKGNDGKWSVLDKKAGQKETKVSLDPNAPGGVYKFSIKSMASLRESSDTVEMEFSVYEGARTPAAIEEAKLREAIEKEYNSYFIASYLLTSIDYLGSNRQAGKKAKFDFLSGTGRLGYGYYKPKSSWGFVGIVDLSGVTIGENNYLYSSAETQVIWRTYLAGVTQLRLYTGLFLRQLPESVGQTVSDIKVTNVTTAGPHAGFQLWHPFSYKFGVQVNGQVLPNLIGLSTPNGRDIEPTLSYQFGLLGSYKLQQNMTGFAGYAYRVDSVSYKAKPFDGSDFTNFAREGDINEVTMTGHYLNLYLEWGF